MSLQQLQETSKPVDVIESCLLCWHSLAGMRVGLTPRLVCVYFFVAVVNSSHRQSTQHHYSISSIVNKQTVLVGESLNKNVKHGWSVEWCTIPSTAPMSYRSAASLTAKRPLTMCRCHNGREGGLAACCSDKSQSVQTSSRQQQWSSCVFLCISENQSCQQKYDTTTMFEYDRSS